MLPPPAALLLLGRLITIKVEDKEANSRRQVAVLPRGIDLGHQFRAGHFAQGGDLRQVLPEFIFEADARLATGDDEGTLDDRRFHRLLPLTASRCLMMLPIHLLRNRRCTVKRSILYCSTVRTLATLRFVLTDKRDGIP